MSGFLLSSILFSKHFSYSNKTKLDQTQSAWYKPRVLIGWSRFHGRLNLRAAVIIRAFRAHILYHRTERPWKQSLLTIINEATHY